MSLIVGLNVLYCCTDTASSPGHCFPMSECMRLGHRDGAAVNVDPARPFVAMSQP